MNEAKREALRRRFPWLPPDCVAALCAVVPGRRRFGIEWFEEPRRPADVGGVSVGRAFPTAWWIGRRDGDPVGFDLTDPALPMLCAWGGSQQRVRARFAGIDALALSQLDPAADRRPQVEVALRIPGLAFGPWRSSGTVVDAPCMFSVGSGDLGVDGILGGLEGDRELMLIEADRDAALCVRKHGEGYALSRIGHGHFGAWTPASVAAARAACTALVPHNDGSDAWSFGRLTLPGDNSSRDAFTPSAG